MKQERFEQRHAVFWQQLEDFLSGVKANMPAANSESASENQSDHLLPSAFPAAYRQICHHLAVAKARRYSTKLIVRLNNMVLRGHQRLYQRKTAFLYQTIQFVLAEFPCSLRRHARLFWLASAIFYLPGLLLFVLVSLQPELVYSVIGPQQLIAFEDMYNPALDKIGRERQSDTDLAMFGFYIYNNIGIAFQTFAAGFAFVVGTVFYLIFNGVLFGALSAHIVSIGYQDSFFPFVVGHASFELTAITIAGAAGMKLGFSLFSPGNVTRLTALKAASAESIKLIMGAALLLLVAAFIEAFWSSTTSVSPAMRYMVGAFLWLFVIGYLSLAGKGSRFET